MFTGIVTDIGTIIDRNEDGGDLRLSIATGYDVSGIKLGESIACNGCCLTVICTQKHTFDVQLSAETLACTADAWNVGDRLNLERALKMGDDISGHLVSGHVDGVAVVKEISSPTEAAKITSALTVSKNTPPLAGGHGGESISHKLTFSVPTELTKFIAPKGSVTLNGVSLTVNEVSGNTFTVNIIPHTWEHTNFSSLEEGDAVNLEVDMLARYVAQMIGAS